MECPHKQAQSILNDYVSNALGKLQTRMQSVLDELRTLYHRKPCTERADYLLCAHQLSDVVDAVRGGKACPACKSNVGPILDKAVETFERGKRPNLVAMGLQVMASVMEAHQND